MADSSASAAPFLSPADFGLTASAREWKRNTDCAELRARLTASEVCLLQIKHDLDSWADLRLIAQFSGALASLARFVIQTIGATGRAAVPLVNLAAQLVRVRGQMPPPPLGA